MMKKKLLLLSITTSVLMYSQSEPQVTILTTTNISGRAELGSTVFVDTDASGAEEYKVVVDEGGKFNQTFSPSLTVGNFVIVWSEKKNKDKIDKSTPIAHKIRTEYEMLQETINSTTVKSSEISAVERMRAVNLSLANTVLTYKATILNTNFSIPIVRFNLVEDDPMAKGNVTLFTSIGAGIGFSAGRMEVTRNNLGETILEEFSSTLGVHAGVLFSAGTGEDVKNIFAPTINISILDIQFGIGHELGTISEKQKRTFYTISYAIPLQKLIKKSYRVWYISNDPISIK